MKANGEKKVDEKALLESPLVVKIQVSFSLETCFAGKETAAACNTRIGAKK